MKFLRLAAVAALLVWLAAAPSHAQAADRARVAITGEPLAAPGADESHMVRFSGAFAKADTNVFSYIDFYGPDTNKWWTETYLRRNLAPTHGLEFEFRKGGGRPGAVLAGYVFNLPVPANAFLAVKLLPIVATASSGFIRKPSLGVTGNVRVGAFYVENWSTYAVRQAAKPVVITEFTAGRRIKGPLSLQTQIAYNVHSPDWAFRAGVRYVVFSNP